MTYLSDKEPMLSKGRVYYLDGVERIYLGRFFIDGGRETQYRFKRPIGENTYRSLTARELDNADLIPRMC